jgi:hypothetical protein
MDINDEMMIELFMQDEAEAATDQEQCMMALTTLLCYRK